MFKQRIPQRFKAEKRDLEFFRRRLIHDALTHQVISFDGKLGVDRLLRAIRLSLDVEPVLGCRFVDKFPRPYWEQRKDLDQIAWCTWIETEYVDEEIEKFLLDPIVDLTNDPQIKFLVIRSQTDTLCIKTNHMLSDIGGNLEYISLLSEIYRNLKTNPDYTPPANVNSSRSLSQINKNFLFKDRLKIILHAFRNWKSDLFPPCNWTFPFKEGDPNDRAFVIKQFRPERYRAIKGYGQKYGASVNDVLITAYYHALHEMIKPSSYVPLRLMMAVDFRKYISSGKGEAACNLAGVFQFNIGQKLGDNFYETLIKVKRGMDYYKKDYMGLGDYSFMFYGIDFIPFSWAWWLNEKLFMLNLLIGPQNRPPGFSNAGMVDSKYFNFGDIHTVDVISTGPVMPPSVFFPTISCFGENLKMCFGFSGANENRAIVDRFFSLLIKNLPK